MKPELIKINLEFLQRVDLKGNEAPVFMNLIQALNEELQTKDKKATK